MHKFLERLVWQRAGASCEYCRIPQELSAIPFEIDHVIARKHGGKTQPNNLALSCFYCNSYKGSNIAGLDPKTGKLTRLFDPRRDHWEEHFNWTGPSLSGRTSVGRTTIRVLEINHVDYLAVREALIAEGRFPPA
jgi:hypothetical protein